MIGYVAAFTIGCAFASGVAFAATNDVSAILGTGAIAINHQEVSITPKLVYDSTTFMPVWYLQQALDKAGVANSWNGYSLGLGVGQSPSSQQIVQTMEHTKLQSTTDHQFFIPVWNTRVTISDGQVGTLTAIEGICTGAVYGNGQGYAVFLWHDDDWLGWSSSQAQKSMETIMPSGHRIAIAYNYHTTGSPNYTYYSWDGSALVTTGRQPTVNGPAAVGRLFTVPG